MTQFEIWSLVFIGIVSFAMSYLGAAVGLVLGHFRVVLIGYVLGSAAAGIATSMAISTVSTFSGAVAHARGGRVQLVPVILIGVPSAVAAYVAAGYAGRADPRLLKLAIACALLVAAGDLLLRRRTAPRPLEPRSGSESRLSAVAAQVLVGTVLGTISGFVGLLLGSLRLPAMVRIGVAPRTAIGTNMTIGAITGLSAGLSALTVGKVNFEAFAIVAPMAFFGSHFGAQQTGKLDAARLTRWIAVALVVTAAGMFLDLGLVKSH